jgi:hypothetical protein
MFIQDAYLELNLHKAIQLDAGMLLAPFSHHGMQAATSLMSLDYHGAAVLKYPAGSNKVWRDNGIMARGLVANDHLEYRLGIFNGVRGAGDTDPRNPDDLPRVTGRITANIFEAEGGPGVGGMFYDSMYIKKTDAGVVSTKKVLSIGASFDWQPDLNVYLNSDGTTASTKDYAAVNTDVFWTLPFKDKTMSVDGQVNFYYYYFGDRGNASNRYNVIGDTKSYTGYGIMSELGLRIKAVQPLIIIDGYNSTEAMTDTEGDYLAVYGGFNYYMLGNSTTFKLQVGSAKINDGDWKATATLQAQLVF